MSLKGRTEDIRVTASINFSRYYLKIRREERGEIILIHKDDFLDREMGNFMVSIFNVSGEPFSARIFVEWVRELHKEFDAIYKSFKWLKRCHDSTWSAFITAVSESSIADKELFSNAIMKGIGSNTFMDKTTIIPDIEKSKGDNRVQKD